MHSKVNRVELFGTDCLNIRDRSDIETQNDILIEFWEILFLEVQHPVKVSKQTED